MYMVRIDRTQYSSMLHSAVCSTVLYACMIHVHVFGGQLRSAQVSMLCFLCNNLRSVVSYFVVSGNAMYYSYC